MLNNEELIKKVKSYNRFFNPDALTKAYNFALEAHKTKKEMRVFHMLVIQLPLQTYSLNLN